MSATETLDAVVDASATETSPAATDALPTPDARAAGKKNKHVSASDRIVAKIVKNLMTEGERNFSCGEDTWDELLKRRASWDKFQPSDYDKCISDIVTEVRCLVSIDSKSIRLADWTAAHVLRELCRAEIGELADQLDYYEYAALSRKDKEAKAPRTLYIDKKNVAATLVEGWLSFVSEIANERLVNGKASVKAEDFDARMKKHAEIVAASKAVADPALAAMLAANKANAEKARLGIRMNAAVSRSITDAVASGTMNSAAVIEALANTCHLLDKPFAPNTWLNPEKCGHAEHVVFVKMMIQLKRWNEIRDLANILAAVVAKQDSTETQGPDVLKIEKVA